MSSAAALPQVSGAIQALLQEEFSKDAVFQTQALSVVLDDPSKQTVHGGNTVRLSLWLYQVVPDEFLRNLPPTPVKAPSNGQPKTPQVKPTPLALNLYYLVTPLTGGTESDQRALGLAMLTLHLHPEMALHNQAEDVTEQVRIGLVSDQLEDRIRLWESLSQPYRLSVCYLVRTVRIEAPLEPEGARVAETTSQLGDAPQSGPGAG